MSSSSRSRVFAWRICIEQSCDETYVADLDSICLLAYEFKNIPKRPFSLRFNSLILDHLGFVSHERAAYSCISAPRTHAVNVMPLPIRLKS